MEFIRRSSDYGLRSLIYMARFPKGKVFSLGSVAKERRVSPIFLHKIFQRLSKAGIVMSNRGVQGGFSIAKDPAKITVREVVEVLQGPIAFNRCLTGRYKCNMSRICSIKRNLNAMQKKFTDVLDRLTIRELAGQEKALLQGLGLTAKLNKGNEVIN